jgi:hypothetical protein
MKIRFLDVAQKTLSDIDVEGCDQPNIRIIIPPGSTHIRIVPDDAPEEPS